MSKYFWNEDEVLWIYLNFFSHFQLQKAFKMEWTRINDFNVWLANSDFYFVLCPEYSVYSLLMVNWNKQGIHLKRRSYFVKTLTRCCCQATGFKGRGNNYSSGMVCCRYYTFMCAKSGCCTKYLWTENFKSAASSV